jgi:hypothetical protein
MIHLPLTAEIMAIWRTVKLYGDLGVLHVVFEGEYVQVVSALTMTSSCLEAIKIQLLDISHVQVRYILRGANQAAHLLANTALVHCLDHLWVEEVPSYIRATVFAE